MTNRTLALDDALHRYLLDVSLRESPLLERLRAETAALPTANWQIAPEQGQFMALLVRLMGARRVLEVGTYTGYSALVMAEALPEDGRVVCLDRAGDYHAIARRYWHEAGVEARIQLRTGEALACLETLEREGVRRSTWPSSMPTRPTTRATWSMPCAWCVAAGWCCSTTCCGAAVCCRPSPTATTPVASRRSTVP